VIGGFIMEALAVLSANRMRSFLTTLGLIIGVGAVIAIQTLGSGMAGAVGGVLGSLSERSFILIPNGRQSDFTRAAIKISEIDRAKRAVPNVVEGIPAGGASRLVRNGHARARLVIVAESDVRFITTPLRYGHALERADVESAAHVCMLTDNAYERLFPEGGDPTGTSVRVGDRRYVIAAILDKPKTGILPNVVRGDIFIPYTTYERDFVRGRPIFGARFIIGDPNQLVATEQRTVAYFTALKKGRVAYQTFDRKSLQGGIGSIFSSLTVVVGLIGAVSLLVAGIGILNIMLVSVAERTREIGLRKAIGATRMQILAQFFIEALVLSAVGCAIGLALGLTVGYLINRFGLVALSGVVAPIPWVQSVVIATGFATLVTLVFGTYPAYRAAALDPIDALRYE